MEEKAAKDVVPPRPSSARWQILRRAILPSKQTGKFTQMGLESISRRPINSFNMIPVDLHGDSSESSDVVKDHGNTRETCVCYTLPVETSPKIVMIQRTENHINLTDFEISNRHNIDNTGLVCSWPSEDVLAHFCLNHVEIFRSKKVLELGSGYGLAGLSIAAGTNAYEVVISDGNPQVVDYIKLNISANSRAFDDTKVKSMLIHWTQKLESSLLNYFDIIVASDCTWLGCLRDWEPVTFFPLGFLKLSTFFKEFHEGLAITVRSLLRQSRTSEAIFLNPRRGDSLDLFLQKLDVIGLQHELIENYDGDVWSRHLELMDGNNTSWPNYDKDHCYPILILLFWHRINSSSVKHELFSRLLSLVTFSISLLPI